MPVKKIKNIGVEVSIIKEKKSIYVLDIIPTEFRVEDDSLYEAVYNRQEIEQVFASEEEFIRYVVEKVLKTLREVKIDKLNGKFVIADPLPHVLKTDMMMEEFCKEFKDDETIELAMNECCVCYVLTKTKTNCGHSLCLECISKLKTELHTIDMMRNVNHIGCPMCRQRITSL